MISPTNLLEQMVHSREKSSPNKKEREKCEKMEYLGTSSKSHIVGSGSSASGWSGSSFGAPGTGAA